MAATNLPLPTKNWYLVLSARYNYGIMDTEPATQTGRNKFDPVIQTLSLEEAQTIQAAFSPIFEQANEDLSELLERLIEFKSTGAQIKIDTDTFYPLYHAVVPGEDQRSCIVFRDAGKLRPLIKLEYLSKWKRCYTVEDSLIFLLSHHMERQVSQARKRNANADRDSTDFVFPPNGVNSISLRRHQRPVPTERPPMYEETPQRSRVRPNLLPAVLRLEGGTQWDIESSQEDKTLGAADRMGLKSRGGSKSPSKTTKRATPHCRICDKPMKGHPKVCPLLADISESMAKLQVSHHPAKGEISVMVEINEQELHSKTHEVNEASTTSGSVNQSPGLSRYEKDLDHIASQDAEDPWFFEVKDNEVMTLRQMAFDHDLEAIIFDDPRNPMRKIGIATLVVAKSRQALEDILPEL